MLTADAQPVVKIGDFGIAVDVEPNNRNRCLKDGSRLRCSPGYGAPEIVKQQKYGLPVDMWSLGVCLFLLLTGVQVLAHIGPCSFLTCGVSNNILMHAKPRDLFTA